MAVRLPLLTQDDEAIKEWSNADRDQVHKRIAYCYANDPSVYLSVVANNGDISPAMSDTRYKSGAASQNVTGVWPEVTSYTEEPDTEEPQLITITYDKVSQTRSNPGLSWGQTSYPGAYETGPGPKPVYYEGRTTGNPGTNGGYSIREMSFQDVLDTFIDPVVNNILTLTTDPLAGGTHFISTATSIAGCTDLGVIFTDTKATVADYDATLIGEDGTYQDHNEVVNNFRLYKNNGVEETYRLPLVIDYTSNGVNAPAGLREMTQAEFIAFFCPLIKQQIYNGTGNTLNYNFDGDGTTKGSAITNTALTSVTGNYQTYEASADDYRSQEFPNGTLQTIETWRLKLNRT